MVPRPQASAPEGASGSSLRGALAFLVAFAVALHARQLFLGQLGVLRDHLVYTWTERLVLARGLQGGTVPEWNDLIGLGTQFAASSANGVTYPPLWIVALFPLPFSMDLVVAIHVLLAGVGTALLARRLGAGPLGAALAGAALMGSGYVASIAPNKVFVGTAWIPWVAWSADRLAAEASGRAHRLRDAGTLAALLAAQHLAGDPASSITGGLVALSLVLARAERPGRGLGHLVLAACASVPLAAASLLPGLALLPSTTRAALLLSEGTRWSLHPWRLPELLWPRALGDPTDATASLVQLLANAGGRSLEPAWSLSAFVGSSVLALAVLAAVRGGKGTRRLWIATAGFLLLALGEYTPLYGAWRAIFPPEQIIRYPEKHLVGALVLLCALAGAGTTALRDLPRRWASVTFAVAVALLALPLTALALCRAGFEAWLRPGAAIFRALDLPAAIHVSLRAGGLALVVALVSSALFLASRRWRLAGVAAVGLVAVHLLYEGWAVTPVGPGARLSVTPRLLERLAPREGTPRPPPRVLRSPVVDADLALEAQAEYRHETLVLDGPGRFGVAALPGFEGWQSRTSAALWERAGAMPLASFQILYAVDAVVLPSELREALFPAGSGLGQGVVAQVMLDAASDHGRWALVRSTGIRPRAFVAPRWRWEPFQGALAATVTAGREADPGLVVLTGTGRPSPAEHASLPLLPCDVTGYRPERVELDCSAPAGGFAVLVDEMAEGWIATVDGVEARVETADVVLRAVAVEPGRHRVVLTYRTPWLRTGVLLSALAWAAWLWLRWRRPGATAGAPSRTSPAPGRS
jgi:hypothetical protein